MAVERTTGPLAGRARMEVVGEVGEYVLVWLASRWWRSSSVAWVPGRLQSWAY
jgi:hypothetical protein